MKGCRREQSMATLKADDIELWARLVDDDGEERFEKIHKLTDEEVTLFNEDDEDDDEFSAADAIVKLVKHNYFLEGMVHAYEKMLCICADEDEDE